MIGDEGKKEAKGKKIHPLFIFMLNPFNPRVIATIKLRGAADGEDVCLPRVYRVFTTCLPRVYRVPAKCGWAGT